MPSYATHRCESQGLGNALGLARELGLLDLDPHGLDSHKESAAPVGSWVGSLRILSPTAKLENLCKGL